MRNADSDYRGVAARISLAQGVFRELLIEFQPTDHSGKGVSSGRNFEARLKEYAQKAMALGWRPESRGKPFRIEASELEG
jgi:hypothetical protein